MENDKLFVLNLILGASRTICYQSNIVRARRDGISLKRIRMNAVRHSLLSLQLEDGLTKDIDNA